MTHPTHLAALYNAAEIILWVEDRVTAAYLKEIWGQDPRFALYIGGGHENLAAVVEDAQRSGRGHVFGLRDRDFGPTNRLRWHEANVVNLALETFEIECFLLDPPALAACRVNFARRSESEIRARLHEHAAGLLWWMACRQVIAGLREARQQHFPSHPKRNEVTTEKIIGELVSWIYTRKRPEGPAGLEDLAKAVAEEQTRTGRAPVELLELRDALVGRLTSRVLAST